jgi:molybdopterin converting factor small subunit
MSGPSSVKVHIPTPLRSYTSAAVVDAEGATVAEVFADLERRFPGIRFRVIDEQDRLREHIKIFINQTVAQGLDTPVQPGDNFHIIPAISGG